MIEIWKLAGGLAFFLIGVNYLEESIHYLTGRTFKLFIKKYTSSNIKAVLTGVISSAILQSSSVVNLITMAFVGANIIKLQHALALVIGSNFGTTLGSWVIAGVGFSLHIENVALSLSGVFGIAMMLTNKESNLYQWNKLLFGFGFLFLGLSFITGGMHDFINRVDLTKFIHLPTLILFVLGFIFTAIIQSSTVTVAVLLAALHINAVNFGVAMAILLGAEIGTAVKLIIASINGPSEKKQLAYGNLYFNLFCTIPFLFFLPSVEFLIVNEWKIKNKLIGLVLFQSLINLLGILLVFPLIKYLTDYIVRYFTVDHTGLKFIDKIQPEQNEASLKLLEDEIKNFMFESLNFTKNIFLKDKGKGFNDFIGINFKKKGFYQSYEHFKAIHGFCHEYALSIEKFRESVEKKDRFNQLISSNRNIMYALKSIKDAYPDIIQLLKSSNNVKFSFYIAMASRATDYCNEMLALLLNQKDMSCFEKLKNLYARISREYASSLDDIYDEKIFENISEIEISTLINFNRAVYAAFKSYVIALKDYLLQTPESAYFDRVPGFIH